MILDALWVVRTAATAALNTICAPLSGRAVGYGRRVDSFLDLLAVLTEDQSGFGGCSLLAYGFSLCWPLAYMLFACVPARACRRVAYFLTVIFAYPVVCHRRVQYV
jgi:hypothetical protein